MRRRCSALMIVSVAAWLVGCMTLLPTAAMASAAEANEAIAGSWRAVATEQDRARLRGWYSAWQDALADARARGFSMQIAGEGLLLDPEAALLQPELPMGNFRCRTVKLGSRSDRPGFVAYDWFPCQIGSEAGVVSMIKTRGAQRMNGRIFPDDMRRQIFLGTLLLGEETMALDYGSDRLRDMAGIIERIGERRWRMVLPRPAFESLLDVIEIVPAE